MGRAVGTGGNRPRHGRPWYHLAAPRRATTKEIALSSADPNYDSSTDTYRQIYRGHDNASAVTNAEGLTVYFDPDTNEVLGFAITGFSRYYEAHRRPTASSRSACRPRCR